VGDQPLEGRPRRFLGVTAKHAGTAVALVTSCVALAFTLKPEWIPDPRSMLAAELMVQSVEEHVSLGRYLRRFPPQALVQVPAANRKFPGYIVYLRVKIEGRKHSKIKLDNVTYGWKSGRPFHDDEKTPNSRGFEPGTPNDQWIAPIWVADPKEGKDLFIRLRLFDEDNVLLAFADTPKIKATPVTLD
jgi:hypothetical protein